MSKTIKMIELLIKSSKGEEVPKKIKFEEYIFELDNEDKTYVSENGNFLTDSINFNLSNLNDEVEIIEDEEEIDIQSIEEIVGNTDVRMNNKEISAEDYFYTITNIVLSINELKNKQNESLKAVKQLDKKVNSIEQK